MLCVAIILTMKSIPKSAPATVKGDPTARSILSGDNDFQGVSPFKLIMYGHAKGE